MGTPTLKEAGSGGRIRLTNLPESHGPSEKEEEGGRGGVLELMSEI